MNTTGVIPAHRLTTIVEHVDEARRDIATAFALLQGAKERLKLVLGDGSSASWGHLWEHQISDYDLGRTSGEVDTQLTKTAWRCLIAQTGLKHYMTEARQKELMAQLERGALPALTVENILSTLQGLTSQVPKLLQESAQEVFAWLRPSIHTYYVGHLKTNKRWRIGEKVIVHIREPKPRAWSKRISNYQEPHIRAMGNVFSLLDGQGVERYPQDTVTVFNQLLDSTPNGQWMALPYFKAKVYGNGNCHMVFLRPDLVAKLNQLGGDGVSLPGES